jgi:hypothetical protein
MNNLPEKVGKHAQSVILFPIKITIIVQIAWGKTKDVKVVGMSFVLTYYSVFLSQFSNFSNKSTKYKFYC